MACMPKDWYREEARKRFAKQLESEHQPALEVDLDAPVSLGQRPGGWVQCWVYIPDPHGETTQGTT